ncbi:bifunctional sugar phosphate isomerase/epimerase/4-hydroxyphenylpyruvate dioxygenase family protein [Promicromonospora panici]|uniref:bifunctional sugar phosphate isomerase/epimerase/4-hydroxyphenylpyruvate dioxygenase family protein n=1 Tax=Promicromonospora panici TaxID=2219658 RepID=UPI00101B6EA3|nr:sugar phosphate isomerase/epimerase and 4-hydroxyphenylpyruvate domain-containing protein [Promicromonospora panici]
MRKSIATVCLSGSLEDKLYACADAGFDGVEIFEPDLVVNDRSPEEIRALADRIGLRLDLYQPFRDFEGVTPDLLEENLRRARARFETMRRLGIDTVLVCSNVATATVGSDQVAAEQLRRLGDLAATYGVRVAYEALAWGRFVDDYRRSWRIAQLADHEAVGVCLDSFHILSRGHDPAAIEDIPGEKIFFVQLADAPDLTMDVLSWSRHHRLFPGEGVWDLGRFVTHLTAAGYPGPLSLEVFNDVFRQTDTRRTAEHALRSLVWLEDRAGRLLDDAGGAGEDDAGRASLDRIADVDVPTGYDYVEIKAEDTSEVEVLLDQLGLSLRGQHRTKPVRLWASGEARIVLNEQHARDLEPHLAGIGLAVADAATASERARALAVRPAPRRTQAGELDLAGFVAPSGLEVFLNDQRVRSSDGTAAGDEPAWAAEFDRGRPGSAREIIGIDHVNVSHGWDAHDEAVLFYTSVLGLEKPTVTEAAGPQGLVRSQVMRTASGAVRISLNVAPVGVSHPEHIALACTDVVAVARRARERGLAPVPVPDNYYDDLRARFGLDDATLKVLREYQLMYDRSETGEFWHFYTPRIGRVCFEVVQRIGGYDVYATDNTPVLLAAQDRLDRRTTSNGRPGTR